MTQGREDEHVITLRTFSEASDREPSKVEFSQQIKQYGQHGTSYWISLASIFSTAEIKIQLVVFKQLLRALGHRRYFSGPGRKNDPMPR